MVRTRRHALGQNFLHHKPTIAKIIDTVDSHLDKSAKKSVSMLEVGPGALALTDPLVELAASKSLPLIIVERDRHLEEGLNEGFDEYVEKGLPRPELHFMDAATEKFTKLIDDLADRKLTPFYFASNLPYSAGSQILANLCARSSELTGATVMLQKEVAERICAEAGASERGSFSLLIQTYFKAEVQFHVGPGAFNPPPKVTSTVITLTPHERPLIEADQAQAFEKFCKMLFSQRRKMIRKTLPPKAADALKELGLDGTERPEVLELGTVIQLFLKSV